MSEPSWSGARRLNTREDLWLQEFLIVSPSPRSSSRFTKDPNWTILLRQDFLDFATALGQLADEQADECRSDI